MHLQHTHELPIIVRYAVDPSSRPRKYILDHDHDLNLGPSDLLNPDQKWIINDAIMALKQNYTQMHEAQAAKSSYYTPTIQ